MWKRTLSLLALAAWGLGTTSCAKLPSAPPPNRGPLPMEAAAYVDAIPLDYGTLIAATNSADQPYHVRLWFEKEDKTVVCVKVNVSLGKIERDILVLPRR